MTSAGFEIISESSTETAAIGGVLADWLQNGDVVLLHGDLGAGKTTLVKGVAEALKIDAVVSSPSFSLVNEYDVESMTLVTRLFHLDLYRLQGEDELASIGFADFAAPDDGVTIVEWPERATRVLPDCYLLIEIELQGPDSRRLRFVPVPDNGSWTNRFLKLQSRLKTVGN